MLGPDCLGLVEQWLEGRKEGRVHRARLRAVPPSPLGQGSLPNLRSGTSLCKAWG